LNTTGYKAGVLILDGTLVNPDKGAPSAIDNIQNIQIWTSMLDLEVV